MVLKVHGGLCNTWWSGNGLEMSQMVWKWLTCGWIFFLGPWLWPVAVIDRGLMVMFQLGELKVWVWVLGQCRRVWWRLVQTGVSSCPCRWGVLWAGLNWWLSGWKWCWWWKWWWPRWMAPRGWCCWWCWGCLTCLWVIKHHGLGVHIVCFIIDVAHSVVERHGSGLMVLKGIVFGLFFPFFSLDGLERRCCHDKWALNELDSFCKLCCWGLGSCKIIHILIFQSQYLLSTWWGLWLACFGRIGLVLSLWGDADLWLDGLCWTVLSVSLAAQQVSGRSDIYWPSWMVLKELYLVLDIHGGSQLGTGGLLW